MKNGNGRHIPAKKVIRKAPMTVAPHSLSVWFDRQTQEWCWSVHHRMQIVAQGHDPIHIDANRAAMSALNRHLAQSVLGNKFSHGRI